MAIVSIATSTLRPTSYFQNRNSIGRDLDVLSELITESVARLRHLEKQSQTN
jgi:hypothetical protein